MSTDSIVTGLTAKGWTREQAIGVAANIEQESRYNPAAVGDGGKAYGIAQWHPDRQANFEKAMGKSIRGSSIDDQVSFIDWELRNTEKAAGNRLRSASTAADAAAIFSEHYERPAARDLEKVNRGRRAAQLANEPWAPAAPAAPKAQQGLAPAAGAPNDWLRVPTYQAPVQAAPSASDATAELVVGREAFQAPTLRGTAAGDAELTATNAADVKLQSEKDSRGFGSAIAQGVFDPRVNSTLNIADYFRDEVDRMDRNAPPDFFQTNRDKILAGRSEDEREYLEENVRGPETLARSNAQLLLRSDMDREYGLAGGGAAFVGQMVGGVLDPVGWLAGAGVAKAAQLARVGHVALAAAGRVGLARAAFVGETALGNVAVEGIQDYMGEVKTSADYVMAAGTGALFGAPFARGAVNGAINAHIRGLVDDLNLRATEEQLAKGAEYLRKDPTMDPAVVARKVAEDEARDIREHIAEASTPSPFRERFVTPEVERQQRAEYAGEPVPEPQGPAAEALARSVAEERVGGLEVREGATPEEAIALRDEWEKAVAAADPRNDVPDTEVTPQNSASLAAGDEALTFPKIDAGEGVTRDLPTVFGANVKLEWRWAPAETRLHKGLDEVDPHSNPREVLESLIKLKDISPELKATAEYLLKVGRSRVLDGVAIRFLDKNHPDVAARPGVFHGGSGDISLRTGSREGDLVGYLASLTRHGRETAVHEIAHAMLAGKTQAFIEGKLSGPLAKQFEQLKDLHQRYREELKKYPTAAKLAGDGNHNAASSQAYREYAAKDLHEFGAQIMGNEETRALLRSMPGKEVLGMPTTAWQEVMGILKRIFGGGKKQDGLTEATALLDRIISVDGSHIAYSNDKPALFAAAQNAGTVMRQRADDIMAEARSRMARTPIDQSRLNVGTKVFDGAVSDGIVLASSKNPILQMFAAVVGETTTGAAGRGATAAIRAHTLNAKFLGNTIIEHTAALDRWLGTQGINPVKEAFNGEGYRQFSSEVYKEIAARRDPAYRSQGANGDVVAAADSLERLFQRSADDQRAAGVLGADALPGSSRGYIPQKLEGAMIQTLTAQELIGLHQQLAQQFQTRMGWDRSFAESFAPYYVDRIRQRSQGARDAEGVLQGTGNSAEVVRQTLEDMALDPSLRDRAAAAASQVGRPAWMKSRLDLDLSQEFAPGRQLFELYNTDTLGLAREYSHRTAGTTALTESGVLGLRGIRELRQAAVSAADSTETATLLELRAFDRLAAEILGGRTGQEVTSSVARDAGSLVRLQRLGGLVFAQAAETWNMIGALGLGSVVRGIPNLGRLWSEVRSVSKGGVSTSPWLKSLEVPGGEFGLREYKVVMPLDPGAAQVAEYMDHPGLLSRLLRTGEHIQSKVSGFRALVSVQHRHVAEEIVRKSLRYINEDIQSGALADMGITPQLRSAIKAELPNIATFDASGRVLGLDMTLVSDPRIAEAFGQVVHRGAGQIIQSRFAGERSAWFSNDYAQLLLQLRGFGLTAVEKQWGRQRMNHGYAGASGLLLAQLAMSLPIYMAKAQIAAAGREDRDEFLKKAYNPAQVVKGLLSYSSLSGITGDVLDTVGGLAGGWGDSSFKDTIGASPQGLSASRLIPVGGTIDSAMRVASGRADLHTALKQLPFSNLWFLQPLINVAKDAK